MRALGLLLYRSQTNLMVTIWLMSFLRNLIMRSILAAFYSASNSVLACKLLSHFSSDHHTMTNYQHVCANILIKLHERFHQFNYYKPFNTFEILMIIYDWLSLICLLQYFIRLHSSAKCFSYCRKISNNYETTLRSMHRNIIMLFKVIYRFPSFTNIGRESRIAAVSAGDTHSTQNCGLVALVNISLTFMKVQTLWCVHLSVLLCSFFHPKDRS